MRHLNIYKGDIINSKVSSVLVNDFKNVINDVGIDLSYYFFNSGTNDWETPFTVKGYVMSDGNENISFVAVKDKYLVLISVESFYSSGSLLGEPSKKDMIKIANKEYHIFDIYYYNVQAEIQNTIQNSMAIALELVYKGEFTRNDLIRS